MAVHPLTRLVVVESPAARPDRDAHLRPGIRL